MYLLHNGSATYQRKLKLKSIDGGGQRWRKVFFGRPETERSFHEQVETYASAYWRTELIGVAKLSDDLWKGMKG